MRHRFAAALAVALTAPITVSAAATLPVPPRPPDAPAGSQFITLITDLPRNDREATIFDAVTSGNIPDFQRALVPVTVNMTISGTPRTAVYHVLADYLAVGTDADYFLCPMTPLLGQQIADALQCHLPSRRMVDQIWNAASLHLAPQPIPPDPDMITVPYFANHNTMVYSSRSAVFGTHPLGTLVGGDKKDVVVSPQIWDGSRPAPPRVAIYGWHQTSGSPIQPLSLVHEDTYADYSHGIRLILNSMTVDGSPTTVENVLKSAALTPLLNDETSSGSPYVYTRTRYDHLPVVPFPLIDDFPSAGRELTSWIDRFSGTSVLSFSPTSPGGDGFVMRVQDPSGGINTARIQRPYFRDMAVECDIYCDYRPAIAADGFERVGLFVRDDGNGMFEGTNAAGTIRGNNYSLCWDSSTGAVHCYRTVNGIPAELLASPVTHASTAWCHFRIETRGDQIRFILDGVTLATVTDATHPRGHFGVGYHEFFTTNSNIRGTRADNFSAERLSPVPVGLSLLQSD